MRWSRRNHLAARAVLEGTCRAPREVFETVRSIYVDDARFATDMALLTLATSGSGKRLAKYILSRFESDRSGRACDPETDPGTIEHVLPENPSSAWAAVFPEKLWEQSVYRLGNLTLVEAPANRRVGNAEYPEKVQAYRQSHYAVTRDIAEAAPEQWIPALLDARQRRLAEGAVHLWRPDFA